MRTIWKYPLKEAGENIIELPVGYEIITADLDHKTGAPSIWAVVDTTQKNNLMKVKIFVCGTGHEIPGDLVTKYIGTVTDGVFFWHVFEVIK